MNIDQAVLAAVLFGFLIAATITDIREHTIYNWTTYPGILAGLILNGIFRGVPGLENGLYGFLVCGLILVMCFVLFDIGGGDVKLIAMMGAFLGLDDGIEAMLWTFVLGSVMGIIILIARFGVVHLMRKTAQHLRVIWKAKGWIPPTEAERRPLKRWLFLAPAALCGCCLVLAKPWLRDWNIIY